MMKLYRIIIALALVSFIPMWLNAQQRFEISAGISTPGYHVWEKGVTFGERVGIRDDYSDKTLGNMEKDAYKSSYYPGFSIQAAYKLPEQGFTKRLSVVGYAGLNMVDFEKIDYLSNKVLYSETALKFDVLVGVRYHMVRKKHFMMYTQTLVGGHFDNWSRYCDYNSFVKKDPFTVQVTFLGLRFQSAQGRFCFLTELGTGSEYGLENLIIIPGVRLGLGYTF